VPSFEYNPADFLPKQMLLFLLSRPFDDLKDDLLNKFDKQTLEMKEIYERHNVNTPYVKKNYKEVLRQLFDEGTIQAVSPNGKQPRKGTFGDNILVTFHR